MKKLIAAWLTSVLIALPCLADPVGTVAGAKKEIARYRLQHRKITYYPKWEGECERRLTQMAYAYEGMILSDTAGDFMKNHEIFIICQSKKRIGSTATIVEEAIYPVYSKQNGAHVLRNVLIRRKVALTKKGKKYFYTGLDLRTHQL